MISLTKKFIISIALMFFVGIFFYSEFPEKINIYVQKIKFDYLPRFSQNSYKEMEKSISDEVKEDSEKAFFPFINQSSLDLTLDILSVNKEIEINENNFKLVKYKANFLTLIKRVPELGPAYIGIHGEELFIVQENGLIFSVNSNEMLAENSVINSKLYQSNINKFVAYYDFYGPGQFGIKDILIDQGYIYVSYTRQSEPNCFNTSVLKAEIKKTLDFSLLFSPMECIERDTKDFNAHISGGRLVKFKDQKILLSTGTFQLIREIGDHKLSFDRQKPLTYKAQNYSNSLGKILSIDIQSGEKQLVSVGHRNPQGLYYSQKYNDIFSTEHGPNGGDEVNYNANPDSTKIENFGWPISSYGGHYGVSSYELVDGSLNLKEKRDKWPYAIEPLYKSHQKFGFIEPLLTFAPSVGISQIIEVDKNFFKNQAHRGFVFGTMGFAATEFIPSLSLFFISTDRKNKIISTNQLVLEERIRDLIYHPQNNVAIYSSDSNGVIGILVPIP
jgi:hypothetical protein